MNPIKGGIPLIERRRMIIDIVSIIDLLVLLEIKVNDI